MKLLILALLILSSVGHAQDAGTGGTKDIWYTGFNYKYGLSTTYSDGLSNDLNNIGATNRTTTGLEANFYWKLVEPTLYLGATLQRYVNKFDRSDTTAPDNITAWMPTASLVYTPKQDMADGPYGRLDLGFGFVSRPGPNDTGVSYLIGFGWGFPFSPQFSISPVFTYANIIGKDSYSFTTLGVGVIL